MFKKGNIPWNKEILAKVKCECCGEIFEVVQSAVEKRHHCSKKCMYDNLSLRLSGRNLPNETKKKIGIGNKGKKRTDEVKKKQSNSMRGRLPWNKGIVGYSTSRKGQKHKPETISKLKERIVSEKTRKIMSEQRKGQIPWNKGKLFLQKQKHPLYGKKHRVESIEKMSNSHKGMHAGKKNPNWKGGISFEPYCYKFNEKLKEVVRIRDNRTCQLCGRKENGRKLPVHHVHYDKPNCAPDLVTLCEQCNGRVNFNRDYYEVLFVKKLQERGLI